MPLKQFDLVTLKDLSVSVLVHGGEHARDGRMQQNYEWIEEEENAGRMDSSSEKEKFSIPSFIPVSKIPAEIKDGKKPVNNLSAPIFIPKIPSFAPTPSPVLMQKSEQQESLIPSQLPKTYNCQRIVSLSEPLNEMVSQLI